MKNPLLTAIIQIHIVRIKKIWTDRRVIAFVLAGAFVLAALHEFLPMQDYPIIETILTKQKLELTVICVYFFITAFVFTERIKCDHQSSWLATTAISQKQMGQFVSFRLSVFTLARITLLLTLICNLRWIGLDDQASHKQADLFTVWLVTSTGIVSIAAWMVSRYSLLRPNSMGKCSRLLVELRCPGNQRLIDNPVVGFGQSMNTSHVDVTKGEIHNVEIRINVLGTCGHCIDRNTRL